MKTIFAKYNRERLPRFQTVTKIVEDVAGKRVAIKEALTEEAREHITEMYLNYRLLTDKYGCELSKPIPDKDGTIFFEYVEGSSFDGMLLQSAMNGDFETFDALFGKFVVYLDGFVSERSVIFKPCEKFLSIFGEWLDDEPQDIIDVANIDLIFGNLFLQNDEFIQIDYEWVFDFKIPKNFVLWRSVATFLAYHENSHSGIDLRGLLKNSFSLEKHDLYSMNDANFYKYVCGPEFQYMPNYSIAKARVNPVDEISILRQTIEQQTQTIEQQTQTIEQQTQTIEQQTQTIEQQTQTIEQQTQTIEQQTQTIEQQTQTIEQLVAKNISLENEVIKYAMSRSWALTRPLRVLMRLLSSIVKNQ